MTTETKALGRGALMLAMAALPGLASAAGLELTQHGVKEMAHGYAGTATLLEDSSAIAHNPAGLMRLPGRQASGGLNLVFADIRVDAEFRREKIENRYGLTPTPIEGPGAGRSRQINAVPNLYYSQALNEQSAIGIGLYAPFGGSSEYPSNWAGRYHGVNTEQRAVNINPSFAFQASEKLSVGMGIVIQSYQAEISNQVDLGYLVAEGVVREVERREGEQAARDVAADAVQTFGSQFDFGNTIELDSIAYGFSFGLLWQYDDRTRFGLNYRSRTRHVATGRSSRPRILDEAFQQRLVDTVQGYSNLSEEEAREAISAAFDKRGAKDGPIDSTITFPEVATLSVHHDLNPRLGLMGSLTYVNWSRFDEIRLEQTDNSLRGGSDFTGTGDDVRRRDLVQPLQFSDTVRLGAGARYQWDEKLTLRGGLSFDESPINNAKFRTPRGPDSDRIILGFGASYDWKENLDMDVAYARIRFRQARVNSRDNASGTEHRAVGTGEISVDNLGVQVNYRF
ncbi:MAG: outer membrane protein transport protein [Oleiphilaceae bacterium]|nr:outer membrane protein transport protein [Oleiphilaceae bacterium]